MKLWKMAYPSEHYGSCSNGALRVVLLVVTMLLVGYMLFPNMYLKKSGKNFQAFCPSCDCDCFEDFNLPSDFNDSSSAAADCGKYDPYLKEEMEKNMLALMSEEINLQRRVANETLERSLALATDSRVASWHYQKEAEKCIAHTEACEEARQRADAELVEERRLSAMWENRARELGFSDG